MKRLQPTESLSAFAADASTTAVGDQPGAVPGGGAGFGPYTCPTGSFVTSIALASNEGNPSSYLLGIQLTCNDPAASVITVTNSDYGGDAYTAPLISKAGFTSASGLAGVNGSDVVSSLTFQDPTGGSVTAGGSQGFFTAMTSPFTLNFPDGTVLNGIAGRSGRAFDYLIFKYATRTGLACLGSAGTIPVSLPVQLVFKVY